MGKAGVVLGLIGILIGAGGLVFGFIAWSSLNTIQRQSESVETWYTIDNTKFTVNPHATVFELINNTISIELTSTASVYMSFTCNAVIFPSGKSSLFFFFRVDGVNLDNILYTEVGNLNGGSTEDYFSVHIQHFIESMTAGSHNITVCVSSGNSDVNKISDKILFVQSLT
ncbi:MAG: hypothetical protein ACFFCV_12960 [Promethearchaeota archaeon]